MTKHFSENVFAKRLRELRIARGYTSARKLAEALDINQNTYTRYERGVSEPSLETIYRLCKLLNVSPNELFQFQPIDASARSTTPPGFAESGTTASQPARPANPSSSPNVSTAPLAFELLAWRLAKDLTTAGYQANGKIQSPGKGTLSLETTVGVFRELNADPFATIDRFARTKALASAPRELQLKIEQGFERLIEALPQSSGHADH